MKASGIRVAVLLRSVAAAAAILPITLAACAGRGASPGEIVFRSGTYKCANCHVVAGKGGRKGPDLSHVGAKRDRGWLETHIRDMSLHEPDTKMPPFPPGKMPDADLQAILDWLETLR